MERKSVSNWLVAACLLSCAITIAQPFLHDRGPAVPGGSISNMFASSAATGVFHPVVGKHTLSTRDAKWIIQAGDTGNGIAARLGMEFALLAATNPTVQWRNLQIGQVLRIPCDDDDMPPPANSGTHQYTVVAGDTGNNIAAANGISFAALDAANSGVNWYLLQIGQVLNVPAAAPESASMTSSTMSMDSTTAATSTTSVSSTMSTSSTTSASTMSDSMMSTSTPSTTPSSSPESSDSDPDSPTTSTTMNSSDSSPESTTSASTASDVPTESSISSSSTTSVESTSLTTSSTSTSSSTTMSTVSDTSTTTSGTDSGPSSVTSSSSSSSASSSSDTTTTILVTSSVTEDPEISTTLSASSTIISTSTSITSDSEISSSSPDSQTTTTTTTTTTVSTSTTDSRPSSITTSTSPDNPTTTEQTTGTTTSESSTTTSSTSSSATSSDGSNDPSENSFLNPGPTKRAVVLPIVNVRLARNAKIRSTYTVKSGDTGIAIAAANGISFSRLSDANAGVVWTNLHIGQVLLLPSETEPAQKPGGIQKVPRKAGKDIFITYSGPAATPPYPAISSWLSFDTLWNSNMANIGTNCDFASGKVAANTKAETLLLKKAILSVSRDTSVKASFILAMVLQESAGCVRAPTTKSWEGIKNPGLMQSFKGRYTCNTGSRVMQPCSGLIIKSMILDGVKGNVNVGIIPALKTAASNFEVSWPMSGSVSGTAKVDEALLYYQAARIYNSGSIPMDGDLSGASGSTPCYVSDVVNRLMGWVNAKKDCSL